MQGIVAIPSLQTLEDYPDGAGILTQEVAGVQLLARVLATAARADVESVLIICPRDLNPAILEPYGNPSLFKEMRIETMVWTEAFDPHNSAHWIAVAPRLEEQFIWLPWNWVTYKRALAELSPSVAPPVTWQRPVVLQKSAVFDRVRLRVSPGGTVSGVAVTGRSTARIAERFLVAHSGKPTDGIYSNLNRMLCRPFVRLLSHTRVTPNELTLAGLLVAIIAAFMYARGSYFNYVTGALLFFVSGLFDEMDGMIARLKFRESAFGTWFEGIVDNITYVAVFLGIILGLHRQYGNWASKYGIALIAGSLLSITLIAMQRKLATTRGRPHEYAGRLNRLMEADSENLVSRVARQIHIFIKKGVLVHYLLIFTIVGGLPVFLWLAAVGSNLTWIGALYFTHRFFRPRPSGATAEGLQKAA